MGRNDLAVDRMKDSALLERLESRLIDLQSPWPITNREQVAWATEARRIALELRLRGFQGRLDLGESGRK